MKTVVTGVFIALFASLAMAESLVPNFATLTGNVKVEPVSKAEVKELPFLTWGGDVATFYGNGGINTTSDSIFGKMGTKFKMVNGDDFIGQVKAYLGGRPYLRGSFSQIADAAELLNRDPATKPVMILQLTWSAGDHVVARESIKTLNDWRGKKICLQRGGPHEGMVDDALRTANLKWSDITVVWAKNLTGADSPAEMMRADPTIDMACVISPDMIGLCGGLTSKGSKAEGNILNSHVVLSTSTMSRSIADVYCVRSDYYASNRLDVEKFVAGYLLATDKLVAMKKLYNDGKGKSPEYINVLKMSQKILGEEFFPTIEIEVHGLITDATFVGLPGQSAFFNDVGNTTGFDAKQKSALDLAMLLGYVKDRAGIAKANWDYAEVAKLGGLEYKAGVQNTNRIDAESITTFPDDNLDDKTIATFTINFEPNQQSFSADTYASEFKQVIQNAKTFGNAAIVIRGHADPTKTLLDFLKAGMAKGVITREGKSGSFKYFMNGKVLDITQTDNVVKAIQEGQFSGTENNPQETMQAALNLSLVRANQVKNAIAKYAKDQELNLDLSQITPSGVGIREPIIAKPTNAEEAKKNMRVEFRLVRISPESIKGSDFDF